MIGTFTSLNEIYEAFPDEETCIAYLEKLRWNGFVQSPFDPISKVYICRNKRYRCRNTGKYFNVKTGTIFYNSKIELQKWFMAIGIVSTAEKPITSVELAAALEITQKTAWYMLRRIKKYLEIQVPSVQTKPRDKKAERIEQMEVVVEKEKLQMLEWLQLLKK